MNPPPTLSAAELEEQEQLADRMECLRAQGFPTALARAMCVLSTQSFPLRLWIVDNSGSMRQADGSRLLSSSSKQNVKFVNCTRWDELKDTILYHAQLAALFVAPTQFTLLNPDRNGISQIGVAEMGRDFVDEELISLQHMLNATSPGGVTPLARHLQNIHALLSSSFMQQRLKQDGQRVTVVLATDGVPTNSTGHTGRMVDREFEEALQKLQSLPIWIVVRLCTNDEDVVQYYQGLDDRLEWNLEVLDDFCDEAREVYGYNSWLNYALPLHRCREWGFPHRLFDLLDERTLTLEEVRDFVQLVFADDNAQDDENVPDPAVDWIKFREHVAKLVTREEKPWNPVKKRPTAWIDLRELDQLYSPARHRRRLFMLSMRSMGALIAAGGVLWSLVERLVRSSLSQSVQSSSSSATTSPPPIDVATASATSGALFWILGGVVLLLLYVPRGRANGKIIVSLLGVMLALTLPSLWTKSASFWNGIAWMAGGTVLLFGIAAYADR